MPFDAFMMHLPIHSPSLPDIPPVFGGAALPRREEDRRRAASDPDRLTIELVAELIPVQADVLELGANPSQVPDVDTSSLRGRHQLTAVGAEAQPPDQVRV